MKKTAQIIVKKFDGKLPNNFEDLITLPGIGKYTANAILAIAFNKPYIPLDGNIERDLKRYLNLKKDKECLQQFSDLKALQSHIVSHLPIPEDFETYAFVGTGADQGGAFQQEGQGGDWIQHSASGIQEGAAASQGASSVEAGGQGGQVQAARLTKRGWMCRAVPGHDQGAAACSPEVQNA